MRFYKLYTLFCFFISYHSFAQCKPYVKKMIPEMSPFVHNGQMNAQKLTIGETVEADLTFYGGQSYRLLVCAEEFVGTFEVKLIDEEDNIIYTANGSDVLTKDFKIETTSNLTVKVTVPKSNTKSAPGCVAILIGFKLQSPKGNGGF